MNFLSGIPHGFQELQDNRKILRGKAQEVPDAKIRKLLMDIPWRPCFHEASLERGLQVEKEHCRLAFTILSLYFDFPRATAIPIPSFPPRENAAVVLNRPGFPPMPAHCKCRTLKEKQDAPNLDRFPWDTSGPSRGREQGGRPSFHGGGRTPAPGLGRGSELLLAAVSKETGSVSVRNDLAF